MATLTLSIIEIVLLFFGAVILGITIHFALASRKGLKASMKDGKDEPGKEIEEWKMRYFNDVESRDRELSSIKHQLEKVSQQLNETDENANIYMIEAEELRKENKQLREQASQIPQANEIPVSERPNYIDQLMETKQSLEFQNEKINQLLGNIEMFRETEEKQQEILRNNEDLTQQINDLRLRLAEKEKEINNITQKEQITKEMTSMLDNAYNEFNVLQGKMQKLELQVSSSKMINMEYEDLKEGYHKMAREFEDQRLKLTNLVSENQNLGSALRDTEEKLRESNFQRQQLQKRVAYLEELTNDLHVVSEANKSLEQQLKRIGELESMLNVVAEERDQLMRGER
jgi:chromosome segregation ATPase